MRIALIITALFGVIYASAGLLTSLRDVGLGLAVAAAAVLAIGCIDYCKRHDERILEERLRVWCRRDS